MLLIGLGNPGEKYELTRHNVGFMLIDRLAEYYNMPGPYNKFKSLFYQNDIEKFGKVYLLKPQTYMNNSGEAVSEIVKFYKLPPDDLFVIHDDLDLPLGKIKIKLGGGTGGHNGLKSIDQYIGSNYYRIRIGIGRPQEYMEVSNYVLSKFNIEEKKILDNILNIIVEKIDYLLTKKIDLIVKEINETLKK